MKQAIYIASAIPFFMLAIGFEAWVAGRPASTSSAERQTERPGC